mmetsp:Transcript_4915/g.16110  ORF Transcript_4915/g.16110 Transcript_4915/m.16110 type:complete len:158 (+) Transcript_4915:126-599(+)
MNSTFAKAVQQFKSAPPVLTHAQRVCRLYREALKLTSSWSVLREIFVMEADKLRAEFDANKDVDPNSKKATLLVEKGEARLYEYTHPDPYVCAYMPGGTLYMRNPPLPRVVVHNWDVPDHLKDEPETLLNPDMTVATPGRLGNVGPVYVDYANKKMY